MLCHSNLWWRFRKILWPSQNIWNLIVTTDFDRFNFWENWVRSKLLHYIEFVKTCENSLLLKNEKSKHLKVYYVFKWIMCLSRFHSFNTIRILGQKIRCTYCCINYALGLPTSKNSWNKIVISFQCQFSECCSSPHWLPKNVTKFEEYFDGTP